MTIKLKVLDDQASAELDRMAARSDAIRGFLARVVYPFYQNLQLERWESDGGSQGDYWAALSPAYAFWKARKYASTAHRGEKILIASGRLLNSVVGRADLGGVNNSQGQSEHRRLIENRSMKIFTTTPYAEYVDAARSFTGIASSDMERIKDAIGKYIRGEEVALS